MLIYRQIIRTAFITLSKLHRINTHSELFSSTKCYSVAKMSIRKESTFKFTDYDCIGFDLDNTLARYKVGAMIEMEYDLVVNYLIEEKNYSKEHLQQPFDHNFILKGLTLDCQNGNIIRISSDGEVIQAAHGTKFLTNEEILKYYPNKHWKPTDLFTKGPLSTDDDYKDVMRNLLDYYDIVVSLVYARAIDWLDGINASEDRKQKIWPHIFESMVNMFSRDNFQNNDSKYFAEIKTNPDKYYYKCSEQLLKWLTLLKQRGKLLFLITGSHIDFASHTASQTLGPNWKDFFDIIVCYARKPRFFSDKQKFINLDGFKETHSINGNDLTHRGVYTQGNWTDLYNFFQKHLNKKNPTCVYVGDHLVQDIYAPNYCLNLDTVAICEELEAERLFGFENEWHPDEQFLVSSLWGSFFHSNKDDKIIHWYKLMKTHSKLCVPSIEYVARFGIDHVFKQNI